MTLRFEEAAGAFHCADPLASASMKIFRSASSFLFQTAVQHYLVRP
jgi:hypothetical protein